MIIDRARLEDYLENVAQRRNVAEAHTILMRFMCQGLLLVEQFLPEAGRDALDLATAFWLEGKGRAEDLLNARVSCWSYLDARGRSTEIRDQEDAAMRALICVLYAEPESDEFSTERVRWFAGMLDRLGDHSHQVAQLMKI